MGIREVLLIGGDFNARLHYRYPTEHDALRSHVFGRGRDYLEQIADATRENRDLFMGFCRMNDVMALNACFAKPPSKLATYREIGTRIGEEITKTMRKWISG